MTCRPFFRAILLLFLFGVTFAGAATVKSPAQPSNLTVKALGVNSFLLKWKDNSTNEVGWEIRVALKGKKPQRFLLLPTGTVSSYILTLANELPGKQLDFQLAAYNYNGSTEQLSKVTSIVTAKALSPSTFGVPTNFTATAVDDGRIRIVWKDNATSEHGYQMEYKPSSSTKWLAMGNTQPGTAFSISTSGFSPFTTYQFRVRAFKGNPVKFTAYSEVAKAKTLAFQAPADLVAKAESDGAVSFKWKDRSSLEAGFEIEYKTGTADFAPVGTVPANSTSADPVRFQFETDYSFRIRAYRFNGATRINSGYSNTVVLKSSSLAKPTTLAGTATSDSAINLTWKDASVLETGYELSYCESGGTMPDPVRVAAANIQTYTVTKLKPGTLYDFKIRAYRANFFGATEAVSGYTSIIQVRTKDGITGDLTPPIFRATSFVHTIEISRVSELAGLTVTNLPAGLTYDSATRTLTGMVNQEGAYTITLNATFASSPAVTRSLVLRVIRPEAAPVVAQAFTNQNVAVAGTSTVSVTGKFSDPDTASAARVATTLGNFDIILYSLATPLTVDNFLDYVDAGRYDNTFFHRSMSSSNLHIIQGGGYGYTSANGFTAVTKNPAVINEPGVSNLRGTVAMAKLPTNPDSATSEFFVNSNDANAPNLDDQNEGFTVFGRVPDSGMSVVDAINALPTGSYSISPFGSGPFGTLPMNATPPPAVLETDKLVKVTSVTAAPILTYEVLSANPAIATASITGTEITVTGVAIGSTTIQVKATDLDGESVTQDIAVTVP